MTLAKRTSKADNLTDTQPRTHASDDHTAVAGQSPSSGPPSAVLQLQLQLQSQPPASNLVNTNGLAAWMGGQYVGNLMLDSPIDLRSVPTPATHHLAIELKAQLIITPFQSSLRPTSPPDANINPASFMKCKAAEDNPLKDNKRPKRVAKNARPVAPKPASAYARAVEEPKGMTKSEEDSCLTCIKQNRKCGGTKLHMVKGAKRCQNCAFPGTGSCGRVCYWPDREYGILTYEDAVRVLGNKLGGRTLAKNTRKGRLQRQGGVGEEVSNGDEDDETETETEKDGNDDDDDLEEEKRADAIDAFEYVADPGEAQFIDNGTDDFDDPDMASTVATAHRDLYHIIGNYLGFPEGAHTTIMQLDIHRTMRGALAGQGPHRDILEGIPDAVLRSITRLVNMNIADLERILREGEY